MIYTYAQICVYTLRGIPISDNGYNYPSLYLEADVTRRVSASVAVEFVEEATSMFNSV